MKNDITKQRLQELAAINNPFYVNEAVSRNAVIKLEIPVTIGNLVDLFNEWSTQDGVGGLNPDIMQDPNKFQEFKRAVERHLSTWLMKENSQTGEAGQWASDGIEDGAFDPYIFDDPYGKDNN